ncbi:MAG: AI-2E family transporter, partial [Acidobacteria bacterium]|nr:AI-2E family transporter [Acidobacteriota bacterium]
MSLRSSRVFLLTSLVLVLSLFFLILSPFLTPILLALVAGTLFYPLYQRLDRRLGTRPNLSSLCLCVIITFLIVLPLCLLAVRLASETQQALLDYQQSIEAGNLEIPGSSRLLAFWNRLTRIPGIPELDIGASAQAAAREVVLFLVRNSSAILAGLAGFVADFFIMLFTLFFVLRDGESFLN